jgi:hypothetical protein
MGLFKRTKNNNKPLIRQIIDLIPGHLLHHCIQKHQSDKGCSKYMTYDQLVALSFGQLNRCQTLQDISTGISVSETFIADLNLKQSPARSTMGDGNKNRCYQVFEELYYRLMRYYEGVLRAKHRSTIIEEIKGKVVKINDSTTISLCLSLFNWAKFRTAKGGIKIHTCWDDALMLPDIINITEAKVNDIKGLAHRIFPGDTIIVEDRGYFDFRLMLARIEAGNYFVTRLKDNTLYESIIELELPEDKDQHILKDEFIRLCGKRAQETGMLNVTLRRVVVYDEKNERTLEIITNNLEWSAATVGQLYKKRWDIELFFKALKQNLQVKTFVGTSENAVKSQIYIALICYLLLELIRKSIAKTTHAFSNFCERIRICLLFYITLDYVCNHITQGANRIKNSNLSLFDGKPPDLFSSNF